MLDSLDINDVFHKIPSYLKANDTQAALYGKNMVDMSKVSDSHLNRTLQRLQAIYENATGHNASIIENYDDIVINATRKELFNKTRRTAFNNTRRALPWHGRFDPYWDYAYDYMARQKMADCMLTLIYMARHHMKTMEIQQVAAPKDDSYRLAYLWTKLQILFDRILSIYNTMAEKAYTYHWEMYWDRPYYFLMLHQKALKIHTQFDFFFWLIAKIHHKYSKLNLLYQTTPTTSAPPKK